MSFYFNQNNQNRPSCISSQQLNSICEKALIEVNRVFDACLHRIDSEVFSLTLSNFSPQPVEYPLTYVSATNNPYTPVSVTSLTIDHSDNNNFALVTFTISIPLLINYTDASGNSGTANSSVSITRSASLCVPENSLTPINIDISALFSSTIGSFTSETTASITACVQIIVKSIGKVDLLVPTFGYPDIPTCCPQGQESCNGIFNQPIYPTRT